MARRYPFVLIFLATALFICSAYYLHIPFNLRADTEVDYLDSTRIFRVHVIEQPVSKSYGYMLSVRLLSMQDSCTIRTLSHQAILRLSIDTLHSIVPQTGDILLVRTRITRPPALYKGDFDYGRYLRLQHKVGIGYVRSEQCCIIGNVSVRTLRAMAATCQERLVHRYIDAGLSGRALAFVSAITLGEKDEIDSSLRQSFAAAGAAHVLAVSGLHTGIIYAVVVAILTFFGKRRPLYEQRWHRALLSATIVLIMWVYAFVTGLSPSVMRAVLMLTIVQVGWVLRRQAISFNTLAAAACICLWVDPLSLFSVSFQLSFAAVTGILLFVPYLNSLWPAKSKIVRYIRDIITVSIAAMAGTLPVTLYYYGQVARYFLLANLVVLPVAFVLVVGGILTLVLAHSVVGTWLATALQLLSTWLCRYVEWIEHLPGATLQLSVTPWMVLCLVLCIAGFSLYLRNRYLALLVPSLVAIVLFCSLHVQSVRNQATESILTVNGSTLYYRHGFITDKYPLKSRYTFFRYDNTDYVHTKELTPKRMQALLNYCKQQEIVLFPGCLVNGHLPADWYTE